VTTISQFRTAAAIAIDDLRLQAAIDGTTIKFSRAREAALAALPQAEALRDHFKAVRSAGLARLADNLETFELKATEAGAQVHYARNAAEACRLVTDIARRHGVTVAAKSKSMATEEIHLNHALTEADIETVETDLGEWIIQLADEPPSHIIAPAIHKTRQQVAALFSEQAGQTLSPDDIPHLTATARRLLREKFLTAGLGISGANIGVAETGSIVLVTNEGNGRMVTSLPPVHITLMGIEKIAATWDDAAAWLALLSRSATGQPLSIYTTVVTGPARVNDPDGPQAVHIILLDNGRSQVVGTPYEEALQCIRCGTCLNSCPVYCEAGGHAYGSPYSGPIGAVVTPLLFGLEEYRALPHASSLCGACLEVCPARIDLPRMLLALRSQEVTDRILPWTDRVTESSVAFVLAHERLLRLVTGLLRVLQKPFGRNGRLRFPARFNPTHPRLLPALADHSFRELWQAGQVLEVYRQEKP
jgi:L-lactate dehydrogenase complex protein LldF